MSKASYLLKMPKSVKAAAARLAKEDGVSLNQFIAVAVAEKVGTIETAEQFLKRRAAKAKPADLLRFLRGAPAVPAGKEDQAQLGFIEDACATHMLDDGADIRFIQAMLGQAMPQPFAALKYPFAPAERTAGRCV